MLKLLKPVMKMVYQTKMHFAHFFLVSVIDQFHFCGFVNKKNSHVKPRSLFFVHFCFVWNGLNWMSKICGFNRTRPDGATSHIAKATMAILNEKFPGHIISRNSEVYLSPRLCDLIPLDFFLRGYLKRVCVNKPIAIQQLKDDLIRHIGEIEEQLWRDVIKHLAWRHTSTSSGKYLGKLIFTHNCYVSNNMIQ